MENKQIDPQALAWASREFDHAMNTCRADDARYSDLADLLSAGADPDIQQWCPTSTPRMVSALNCGDIQAVAMLITAGADLSRRNGGPSIREIIVGNLMDAERFPEMSYPRLVNAEAIAKLATPEGLAEYQRSCPRCQAILAASKTPAADRLQLACAA